MRANQSDVDDVANAPFRRRLWIVLALLAAGIGGTLALDPIPQSPGYHRFADTRTSLGVPNFNDVLSNLGFALVGVLGLAKLTGERGRAIFVRSDDARPYLAFFVGIVLIAAGSAYYHWEPTNERLLWDRLPMSIAFMAICAAVVADRIDARAGNGWLLAVSIAAGVASLLYWSWTEALGRGDLRFYGLVQFYPMLVLPVIVWLFREYRYTHGRHLVRVLAWYGLSKAFELFDAAILELTGGIVSGHTLKHLAAAAAALVVLRMLLWRSRGARAPVTSPG